eukprot:3170695-Amphidinium_carterae.2
MTKLRELGFCAEACPKVAQIFMAVHSATLLYKAKCIAQDIIDYECAQMDDACPEHYKPFFKGMVVQPGNELQLPSEASRLPGCKKQIKTWEGHKRCWQPSTRL